MLISPRKNEYEAVVALLESDDYDDAKSMAKAIVKAVWSEVLKRDFAAWVYRFPSGGPVIAVGPFASDAEAAKHSKRVGISGDHMTLLLTSPHGELQADVDARQALQPTPCAWCGHPRYVHEHERWGGRCAVGGTGGCQCMSFKKED